MSIHQKTTVLYAPAKLNLALNVLSRRPDGYHVLSMLMTKVSLCDKLMVAPGETLHIAYHNMQTPPDDIVRRAVEGYAAEADIPISLTIDVYKQIPVQAGMGGGSADAACILLELQKRYRALPKKALMRLALSLGADVPYCMQQSPCIAEGIGERLFPVAPPRPPIQFVVVMPNKGISTGALFSAITLPLPVEDLSAVRDAFCLGDARRLGGLLHNPLQAFAQTAIPEIGTLHRRLLDAGALGACMTGSGSALFGVFSDEDAAKKASVLLADLPFCATCHSVP